MLKSNEDRLLRNSRRDRDEASLVAACCALFALSGREGQVLAQLYLYDYQAITDLHAAASTLKLSSLRVFLSLLRQKLAPHDIWVTRTGEMYFLRKEARLKICRELAKYAAPRPRKPTRQRTRAGPATQALAGP